MWNKYGNASKLLSLYLYSGKFGGNSLPHRAIFAQSPVVPSYLSQTLHIFFNLYASNFSSEVTSSMLGASSSSRLYAN